MKRASIVIVTVVALLMSAAQAEAARPSSSKHKSSAQQAGQLPKLVGAGNLPGCVIGSLTDPRPLMQRFHASIMRVVVSPGKWHGNRGEALPCVTAAHSDGYKVQLVIGWASWWPLQAIKSFFTYELKLYGPYAWAVSVGNEQELVPPATRPAQYVRVWRAVEPLIKQITPSAVRVGGEISPWGLQDLKQELHLGLPGIQAVAVHPYNFSFGYTIAQALKVTRQYHLPLWCDEGLREGPDSWPSVKRTVPLSAMAGVAVAEVWDRF